ncbi:MAG: hemolysin family protein [Methanomassiliicoccaceae archaeon]|nr:hemolysin family protein [Methanomassiliicoccaceae archaeon]
MESFAYILIGVLAVLVCFSAFFGAAETSYSSMNHIRMKNLAKEGNKKAENALKLCENYDKLLTTLLIGNNFVNISAATVSTVLFVSFLLENDPNIAAAVSTVVITLILLTFSEITPKCMAMERAEKWAMALVPPTAFLVLLFTPLSIPFVKLKRILTSKMPEDDTPTMTEDELKVMIDEIEGEGTIEKHESELIKSAIEFDDITVGEMYTPRVDMASIEIRADRNKIKKTFRDTGFSRIPVYRDNIDQIVGVIYSKDFYNHYLESEGMKIDGIIRPVKFVPTTMKVSSLLKDLQQSQIHMAVVVDESGGTVGIVTLEDIIEELIGEIWDESDEKEEDMVENPDGSYSALGGANIHDIIEESGIKLDLGDYEGHTVSGFILHKLGHIPMNREVLELNGVRMIVKTVKNRRIKEVTIIRTGRKEEQEKQSE